LFPWIWAPSRAAPVWLEVCMMYPYVCSGWILYGALSTKLRRRGIHILISSSNPSQGGKGHDSQQF
jgi:hypothetical protein